MLAVVPHTSVQGEPGVVFNPKTTGAGLFSKIAARTKASILEDLKLPSLSPSMMGRSEQKVQQLLFLQRPPRRWDESRQSAG